MKIVFYNKESYFELTDEEFEKALIEFDKGKRVFIKRLNVSLSPLYIWAGEKPETRDRIHLGNSAGYAIKRMGVWVSENNPEAKIDLAYYPHIAREQTLEEYTNSKNLELKNNDLKINNNQVDRFLRFN